MISAFKNNKKFKFAFIGVLVVIISSVIAITVSSLAFAAVPFKEGDSFDSTVYPQTHYEDEEDNEYWFVDINNNNSWHKALPVSDNDYYQTILKAVKTAMYNRENEIEVNLLLNTTNDSSVKSTLDSIFNKLCIDVYGDDLPNGGDYLKLMSDIANYKADQYRYDSSHNYVQLAIYFENQTTFAEEELISQFANTWNNAYIKSNPLIQNASEDSKEFYTVKTIYNFLAKHIMYDNEVYELSKNSSADVEPERVRLAHTAYGAFFGNTAGYSDTDTFDMSKMNIDYAEDGQGLYRLVKPNQGRSVCDGYTLAFYYLCKLNGIDCKIVTGDYTSDSGKTSDPHAWNYVYLKSSGDNTYNWYLIDATFSSQLSDNITDDLTVIDYSHFLRGSDNSAFSAQNHQQPYDEYNDYVLSKSDYKFEIEIPSGFNAFISRSKNQQNDSDSTEIENYVFSDFNDNYSKLNESKDALVSDEGFGFNPSGYYYYCNLYEYASGVEYVGKSYYAKDAGNYDFDLTTVNGKALNKSFKINPLDMTKYENYNNELTQYANKAYFIGNYITVEVDLYDSFSEKLAENKDYTVTCYKADDVSKTATLPKSIGNYVIRLDFSGNYKGFREYNFSVVKADVSKIDFKPLQEGLLNNISYGTDPSKSLVSFTLGDTTLTLDKDYSLKTTQNGEQNILLITALPTSEYLEPGTSQSLPYNVTPDDVSSLFNGKNISSSAYEYTGKEIKPIPSLKVNISGNTINLKNGVDFKITSYANNINPGTATVNIEFIGNFTGTAKMYFQIKQGKITYSCKDLTYTGKTLYPNPIIKSGNATLVKNRDYTVSGSAVTPGVYKGTFKGKGNFSNISGSFIYYVIPSKPSAKATTTQNSITVSWKQQGKACAYQVYAYDTSKKKWSYIGSSTSTSLKLTWIYTNGKKTAIKPNTAYKIRVRAYFSAKVNNKTVTKYGAVSELSVRTVPKTLTLKVARSGKTALKTSWNKDAYVTGYQVYLSTSSNFKSGVKSATVKKASTTSYTFKGLKKGKTYYVRVRSYKTVGKVTYYSAYSKIVKIKL